MFVISGIPRIVRGKRSTLLLVLLFISAVYTVYIGLSLNISAYAVNSIITQGEHLAQGTFSGPSRNDSCGGILRELTEIAENVLLIYPHQHDQHLRNISQTEDKMKVLLVRLQELKALSTSCHVDVDSRPTIHVDSRHTIRVGITRSPPEEPTMKPDGEDKRNRQRKHLIDCTNMADIKLDDSRPHKGVSKHVFKGKYKDVDVAVKMITVGSRDATKCLAEHRIEAGENVKNIEFPCFIFPNMKLMKEILMYEQLEHPNLVRLLGYCVRNEKVQTADPTRHGVVAVFEYGEPYGLNSQTLNAWSFSKRLTVACELLDLLVYFEHSPLGSLRYGDMKKDHFLNFPGQDIVKVNDMDDVNNIEQVCSTSKDCDFSLPCTDGFCVGFNAKKNVETFYNALLRELLRLDKVPKHLFKQLQTLRTGILNAELSAEEIRQELLQILKDLDS